MFLGNNFSKNNPKKDNGDFLSFIAFYIFRAFILRDCHIYRAIFRHFLLDGRGAKI